MIKILMIDDDEFDFLTVKKLLERCSLQQFSVEHVNNYQDASLMIRCANHDVYLVDQNLGCYKGLSLIKESVDRGHAAPFILLTGETSQQVIEMAIKQGAADYIPKAELTPAFLGRVILHSLDRKKAQTELLYIANHDELTGLANRNHFHSRLLESIARAKRSSQKVALYFLDLDRFKLINDSLGHAMGDKLLKKIAQRLTSIMREHDVVARLGGDEFIILSENVESLVCVQAIASKILESFTPPIMLDQHEIHVATSIGVSIYPECGNNAETLVRKADLALYRAKETFRGSFQIYTDDLNEVVCQRLMLEKELYKALRQKDFYLVFQPKVDIYTESVLGVEVLIRWEHSILGNIAPDNFIDIAEETGLIVPIGEWVIRTAMQELKPLLADYPQLNVAINVSARQLQDDTLIDVIKQVIESDITPEKLEIELTEQAFIDNADTNNMIFNRIRELGVSLAIDDFGTGYSSLSYLKYFPVNILKIDRCFIQNIISDRKDCAITKAVTELAHDLDMQVVAEGIENLMQLEILRQLKCDIGQGYYFSKPVKIPELTTLLAEDVNHRKANYL
ncbi:EAL domain-containing protein [Thalassotalea fusca]